MGGKKKQLLVITKELCKAGIPVGSKKKIKFNKKKQPWGGMMDRLSAPRGKTSDGSFLSGEGGVAGLEMPKSEWGHKGGKRSRPA